MRFRRRQPFEGLTLSHRKALAFERKKKREQDRFPLFAEEIAANQSSWDQEQARREQMSRRIEQEWRDRIAGWWRKGRRMYFAEPLDTRKKIMSAWREWTGPADATYFIYIVELHNGTLAARSSAMNAEHQAARERIVASRTRQLRLEAA
ncbi:hypothetical protein [Azonexus hydrophilus]|uniref:Uncharacterized protein n=1 Tax=Azonexus hydrophilus TaxID=418702 RepID=A0ABZ2XCJ8_9RHOO